MTGSNVAAPHRVVFFDHVARLSGGELAMVRLIPALRDNVDVEVVLGEHGGLVDLLQGEGLRVHVLPLSAEVRDIERHDNSGMGRLVLSTLAYVWRLKRLLDELEPDILHTNSLKAALIGGAAGRLARVPVVWHVRDRIAADYMSRVSVVLVRVAARLLPTAVVANSRSTLATLPARAGHFRSVIPSAVGPSPNAAKSPAGRSFTIAIVGRLASWKGQHVFLEAFALAFRGKQAIAIVAGAALFGEAHYEAELRRQAVELGIDDQVQFLGHVEDVWDLLGRVDVLAHCSITAEPFGQVVVEGMAAGVPVVAADLGGPREVVTSGVDGLLVRAGDASAYAKAFELLRDDAELRGSLGAAGRVSAAKYLPTVVAPAVLKVYELVLLAGPTHHRARLRRAHRQES